MKKVLVLLALLAAVCGLLAFSAAAEGAAASGICGKNLTWTLDAAGTLTVSGTGAMKDYNYKGAPWHQSRDSIQAVVVESGVTTIGGRAFEDCTSLSSITIPEGITTIGDRAFDGCSSLISITIPESVTAIGSGAFFGCDSLTDVSITDLAAWCQIDFANDSATFIFANGSATPMRYAKNIWLDGQRIVSVTVPEGVTEVKAYTFCGFRDLIQVTIPKSVTTIGDSAFDWCTSLTSINIPESVTTIGDRAFSGCSSLISITIPEGVTTIGKYAFSDCSSLSSITLPQGLTAIGDRAFSSCSSLSSIKLPAGVTTIGGGAFWGCSSLTSITIPEGVTVIQPNVFRGATCIQRVALPKSLKGVAANAFYGCKKIQEVFYAGSEAEWNALPIAAGNDPLKNATIYFNSTIDDYYCRITVVASEGGRVAVSANTAKAGDTVTVTATPYRGYVMSAIYVDGAEISGDTFTVTGNHRVSAVFTRLPIVGGNEDFRLEGITVLDGAGNPLQELPAERLLVTVTVRHLKESGSGAVMLAQYDERGRYQGLLWLTLEEMPQDMTLKVTLPVDNTGGSIAQLKVFLVESLFSPAPVGEAISFGTI